ncbi:MAG: iron-sulfur cluster repair di-iron protein [Draconibacterium sp.]
MEINSNSSVGEIVKGNYKTARIFDQHKIDFCCGGAISVKDACSKVNISQEDLLEELKTVFLTDDADSKYIDSLPLDKLSEYIVARHHSYVRENIPFLQQKLQKLCDVHGENHPELFKVKALFDTAAGNLTMHMQKEELVLFPYISRMVKDSENGLANPSEFGGVNGPIEVMLQEHQAEGERFFEIAALTSDYTCPPDGCNTYRITYQTLSDFEQDLHRHIHLENNILFLKALALEKQIVSKN